MHMDVFACSITIKKVMFAVMHMTCANCKVKKKDACGTIKKFKNNIRTM